MSSERDKSSYGSPDPQTKIYGENPVLKRLGRLAMAFQEAITSVVRVPQTDNLFFREQFKTILRGCEAEAFQQHYEATEVEAAKFAVVVFLDEVAVRQKERIEPVGKGFDSWTSLQFEIYGSSDGGEVFFRKLSELLRQSPNSESADVLEVYGLCLLLGFEGFHSRSSIDSLIVEINEKILKVRQSNPASRPAWALLEETAPPLISDRWIGRLTVIAGGLLLLTVLAFVFCTVSLNSGAAEIGQYAGGIGR